MEPDLDTLRCQLQQLQELHASGTLGDAAYAQSRAALEQRIVALVMQAAPATAAAAVAAPSASAQAPALPRKLLAGIAALVLVLAIGGYAWTGSPQLAMAPAAQAPAGAASGGHQIGPEQILAMVDKLAQRLKDNPNDAEGWGMLGRSYVVLGRHNEALPAYRKALALAPDDAALLADTADALGVVNGRDLAGEPLALVQRALKADPKNLKALSLAGTAAFDRQDFAGAVTYWEQVLVAAPPGSAYLPQVRESIAEARSRGGMPPAAEVAAPAAAPTPAQTQTRQAAVASGGSISGTVTLAASLKAQAAPEDTVFVFARAAEGPRMPLAIVRKQVKDLPFDFVLDDSTAMSPATKLSSQSRVVVNARITKSGNAAPQPGDLAGQSEPLALGAAGVKGLKIEIAKVVGP